MRKFAVLAVLVLMWSLAASAADEPKVEVFGGYSLLHIDDEGASGSLAGSGASINKNFSGWEGALPVQRWSLLWGQGRFQCHSPITFTITRFERWPSNSA